MILLYDANSTKLALEKTSFLYSKVPSYEDDCCIRKEKMMSNKEIFLDVDDYLDLYLLAGKLNDPSMAARNKGKAAKFSI